MPTRTPEIDRALVQFRAATDASKEQARQQLIAVIREEGERHALETQHRPSTIKRSVDGVEGAPDSAITLKK